MDNEDKIKSLNEDHISLLENMNSRDYEVEMISETAGLVLELLKDDDVF